MTHQPNESLEQRVREMITRYELSTIRGTDSRAGVELISSVTSLIESEVVKREQAARVEELQAVAEYKLPFGYGVSTYIDERIVTLTGDHNEQV